MNSLVAQTAHSSVGIVTIFLLTVFVFSFSYFVGRRISGRRVSGSLSNVYDNTPGNSKPQARGVGRTAWMSFPVILIVVCVGILALGMLITQAQPRHEIRRGSHLQTPLPDYPDGPDYVYNSANLALDEIAWAPLPEFLASTRPHTEASWWDQLSMIPLTSWPLLDLLHLFILFHLAALWQAWSRKTP